MATKPRTTRAVKDAPLGKYTVIFSDDSLKTLEELAEKYGINDEDYGKLVAKGLKVLALPDDGKITFNKGGDAYVVDVRKL